MVNLMKKNMVLGILLDVLCSGAMVLAVEFVISLIEKKPFAPDWSWVIWIATFGTVADVLAARKRKKENE